MHANEAVPFPCPAFYFRTLMREYYSRLIAPTISRAKYPGKVRYKECFDSRMHHAPLSRTFKQAPVTNTTKITGNKRLFPCPAPISPLGATAWQFTGEDGIYPEKLLLPKSLFLLGLISEIYCFGKTLFLLGLISEIYCFVEGRSLVSVKSI